VLMDGGLTFSLPKAGIVGVIGPNGACVYFCPYEEFCFVENRVQLTLSLNSLQ
jgi:ABC-type lipopolysaccharide export system ATPase subunit